MLSQLYGIFFRIQACSQVITRLLHILPMTGNMHRSMMRYYGGVPHANHRVCADSRRTARNDIRRKISESVAQLREEQREQGRVSGRHDRDLGGLGNHDKRRNPRIPHPRSARRLRLASLQGTNSCCNPLRRVRNNRCIPLQLILWLISGPPSPAGRPAAFPQSSGTNALQGTILIARPSGSCRASFFFLPFVCEWRTILLRRIRSWKAYSALFWAFWPCSLSFLFSQIAGIRNSGSFIKGRCVMGKYGACDTRAHIAIFLVSFLTALAATIAVQSGIPVRIEIMRKGKQWIRRTYRL